jgi:hypothetical protein
VCGISQALKMNVTGFEMFFLWFQNISGTFTAIINVVSKRLSSNVRTAAIYYFITALFVLLACFDTYFALPLNVSIIK